MLAFAKRETRLLFGAAVLVVACTDQPSGLGSLSDPQRVSPYTPHPRIYYLAEEDTNWNYAPLGRDPVYDRSLPAPWGTTTASATARYVQSTDTPFTTRAPQPAWQGLLGPLLRGVVGGALN